ncbi:MAG TPA: DUF1667 domain-containing protein [Syntrophomonadaceae bacterium]|nr:DUF1667 domain-containing protein [Syntrophomonadaceae bacterium]HPR93345.1 DUF1667 domain-containing protein [Syntrophomonadaceae bacterium]
MAEHNLTCILCPLSCSISVKEAKGQIQEISGYGCKLGKEYAPQELLSPMRTVTSTVKLTGAAIASLPVKTSCSVPRDKIFDCMQEIKELVVNSPVKCGQIIKKNIAGSDADLIATRSIPDR